MEPIRILIVEDDLDWLRGLKAYLNRQPDLTVVEHRINRRRSKRTICYMLHQLLMSFSWISCCKMNLRA